MLAVDIGNTFTRVVRFDGDAIRARRALATRALDLDELTAALRELSGQACTDTVWIASVAPDVNAVVDAAAGRVGLNRRFIRSGVDAIIENSLKTPQTTGVDRLLSALAAGARHFPGRAGTRGYVVLQCGSAATIDWVDGNGVFRGGYIIPGPALWLSGLSGAAQLPDLSQEAPDWENIAVGDNTRDAILHGMAAALPRAVVAASTLVRGGGEGEDLPPVVITGGWGEVVSGMMPGERSLYDRDLLLHGIRIFAEREKGR